MKDFSVPRNFWLTHFDLVLINRALCNDPCASLCQRLHRRHSHLPVVMYSMKATPTEALEALANGISRYLTTPEELLDVAEISTVLIEQARVAG